MWGTRSKSVQDLFRTEREDWVEACRTTAHKLLDEGKASITIDDVTDIHPRPSYIHKNATGSILTAKHFTCIGYTKSRKASRKGSVVAIWTKKYV